jgi:hypothetical protein
MQSTNYSNAFQINGGTSSASPTYIGSSNSSGYEAPRLATLDAKGASGQYGGGVNYEGAIIGQNSGSTTNQGYVTLSGLKLINYGYRAIQLGTYAVGSQLPGFTVQNCEITGGNASNNSTDNAPAIEPMNVTGILVTNNYIHNNIGPGGSASGDHLDAILAWETVSSTFTYNTVISAGAIYGKEYVNQGNEVGYNYVDASMFTSQSSTNGVQDWTGANTGNLTLTSKIHNNVLLSSFFGIGGSTLSQSYGWTTPALIYNNSIVMSNPGGIVEAAAWLYAQTAGSIKYYNNILNGAVSPDYKMLRTSPNSCALLDYNMYPTAMTWALVEDANGATQINTYTTLATFLAAVTANGGTQATYDGHSTQDNTPGFVGSGSQLAQYYQITSGGAAHLAGSTTGLSGGSATDLGAWGNGATGIGCTFGP